MYYLWDSGETRDTIGIDGDFDINTDKFTIASATGNTVIGGTLVVKSDFTVSDGTNTTFHVDFAGGSVAITGDLGVTDNVTLGNASTDDIAINGSITTA